MNGPILPPGDVKLSEVGDLSRITQEEYRSPMTPKANAQSLKTDGSPVVSSVAGPQGKPMWAGHRRRDLMCIGKDR